MIKKPIIKRASKEKVSVLAAAKLAQNIVAVIAKKGRAVVAMCGGRSVAAINEHLRHAQIDWSRVHVFIVDERLVPITNSESNFLLIKTTLLDHINIPTSNIHPFVDANTTAYTNELYAVGGVFDVVFLSSGEDGHIAGLYPHHRVLDSTNFFETFEDSPKPPPQRMSTTPLLIKRATYSVLLFSGASKSHAFTLFVDKKKTWHDCPAKLVLSTNASVFVNLD